ncbi:CoA transferase [Microbacterium sp. BK668]|uniref:CoA transferase n=1 Tax=Microbacterium sp. BK668 TaxID=2512118 RepID=UPI001060C339|nr:CoA transferase [Microbacterium sp. BK668]
MSLEPSFASTPEDVIRRLGLDTAVTVAAPRHPVPLDSRLSVGELAWSSVGAASVAAATIAGSGDVTLDPDRIALAYASERHGRVDGSAPVAFAPLSGFFPAADGWVRTHGNYPHHARALRKALELPGEAGADDVASALAVMPAAAAAEAITARGGIASAVLREVPEVDEALRAGSVVRIAPLGQAHPRGRLAPAGTAPLAGVRVLDLTRVIAGPVATRTLALLGAEVLRIDAPQLPEIAWQHLDTGHGKRSALLDLTGAGDRARFDELAAGADVVVLGYRPQALARLGLAPADLAARHPGIVVAQLSAWGTPDQRGFDSIVQAASGISWIESRDGAAPGALPAQALDHSAGYLLAAAVMALLVRRDAEGGSWLAETSLRRVAAELLGMPRRAEPSTSAPVDAGRHTQTFDVEGSAVTTVGPVVAFPGGPTAFAPPRPWGGDEPAWRAG